MTLSSGDAIFIPPGALSAGTNITIREFPESSVVSKTNSRDSTTLVAASSLKRFEPAGLVFAVPVTISIKLASSSRADIPGAISIYYFNITANAWDLIGGVVNVDEKVIVTNISHFSVYAALDNPSIRLQATSATGGLNGGAVAGIVVGVVVAAALGFFGYRRYKRMKETRMKMHHTIGHRTQSAPQQFEKDRSIYTPPGGARVAVTRRPEVAIA